VTAEEGWAEGDRGRGCVKIWEEFGRVLGGEGGKRGGDGWGGRRGEVRGGRGGSGGGNDCSIPMSYGPASFRWGRLESL